VILLGPAPSRPRFFLCGSRSGTLVPGVLALVCLGCVQAEVRDVGPARARLLTGQAVAVLTSRGTSFEREAAECIGQSLRRARPEAPIVTPEEFRHRVFAYRLPKTPLERDRYLEMLATEPALRGRMLDLGVRYLVLLREAWTTQETKGMPFLCFAGYGGGGCFGGFVLSRESALGVAVFDLSVARPVGEIRASASGVPMAAGAFVLPVAIPLPAFTESSACRELGDKLAHFLVNRPETD
jgi:hypothetical protein